MEIECHPRPRSGRGQAPAGVQRTGVKIFRLDSRLRGNDGIFVVCLVKNEN